MEIKRIHTQYLVLNATQLNAGEDDTEAKVLKTFNANCPFIPDYVEVRASMGTPLTVDATHPTTRDMPLPMQITLDGNYTIYQYVDIDGDGKIGATDGTDYTADNTQGDKEYLTVKNYDFNLLGLNHVEVRSEFMNMGTMAIVNYLNTTQFVNRKTNTDRNNIAGQYSYSLIHSESGTEITQGQVHVEICYYRYADKYVQFN